MLHWCSNDQSTCRLGSEGQIANYKNMLDFLFRRRLCFNIIHDEARSIWESQKRLFAFKLGNPECNVRGWLWHCKARSHVFSLRASKEQALISIENVQILYMQALFLQPAGGLEETNSNAAVPAGCVIMNTFIEFAPQPMENKQRSASCPASFRANSFTTLRRDSWNSISDFNSNTSSEDVQETKLPGTQQDLAPVQHNNHTPEYQRKLVMKAERDACALVRSTSDSIIRTFALSFDLSHLHLSNLFHEQQHTCADIFEMIQTIIKLVRTLKVGQKRNWKPDSLAMFFLWYPRTRYSG